VVVHIGTLLARRKSMRDRFAKLWRDEEGQDLVEYSLLAALIALAAVLTMRTLGTKISTLFTKINTSFTT
jgi:pilus assembly protein Flp/PilA